jgi:hypothetical protein
MTLNIKNDEIYRDVKKLAELTGVSMTAAVGEAVAKRLAELEPKPTELERQKKIAELTKIALEMAAELKESGISSDHTERQPRKATFDELMKIAEGCGCELKASGISSDHSFLYDERGLPI